MMKRVWWVLLFVAAPALGAQTPADSEPEARAHRLRAEVERRFAERVRTELGLSDAQASKLRATHEKFGARRRALMRQQFERRQALQGQMRPGVEADPDSVRKLMDALQDGRAELLRFEEEEDREMAGYLTPVQRAQFQLMRQRFLERVQELRRERRGMRPDRPRRRL